MAKHSHNFVEGYEGAGAFGWNRKTDEETMKFYLQKFSDDTFMDIIIHKLSDDELDEMYSMLNRFIRAHLTEAEYHRHFLKDGTH